MAASGSAHSNPHTANSVTCLGMALPQGLQRPAGAVTVRVRSCDCNAAYLYHLRRQDAEETAAKCPGVEY